jgi:cell division control protein 6
MISALHDSSIFVDRDKLFPKHIPEVLHHREYHMNMLFSLFQDFLIRPDRIYQRVIQMLGPVGSGKTSTVKWFGRQLQREAEENDTALNYVHINCKLEATTRYALYQRILKEVAEEGSLRGHSPEEMLRLTIDHLWRRREYLLLALDDVDYLIRRSKAEEPEGGVVYDLTRLNEMHLGEYQQVLGVILIARDKGFRDLLDPSERSTLSSVVIRLPGYDAKQLRDILKARVKEAFKPDAIRGEIINYVADLSAGKKHNPGDCRFALDILLSAGLIADSQGSKYITLDHVRRAVAETFWGLSTEDLINLDDQSILVLTGAVQALNHEGAPYVSMAGVYEFYRAVCDTQGIKALSYNGVKEIIKDLDLMEALEYQRGRGVSIAGASLKDLSRVLSTLKRNLEKSEGYLS